MPLLFRTKYLVVSISIWNWLGLLFTQSCISGLWPVSDPIIQCIMKKNCNTQINKWNWNEMKTKWVFSFRLRLHPSDKIGYSSFKYIRMFGVCVCVCICKYIIWYVKNCKKYLNAKSINIHFLPYCIHSISNPISLMVFDDSGVLSMIEWLDNITITFISEDKITSFWKINYVWQSKYYGSSSSIIILKTLLKTI